MHRDALGGSHSVEMMPAFLAPPREPPPSPPSPVPLPPEMILNPVPAQPEQELRIEFEEPELAEPTSSGSFSENWLTGNDGRMDGMVKVWDGRARRLDGLPPWCEVLDSAPLELGERLDYRGPYPFWMRNEDGLLWGPISYERVEQYLLAAAPNIPPRLRISSDEVDWIDLDLFAKLSSQEFMIKPPPLPQSRNFEGELKRRSVTAILAALAARGQSGRLVLEGERPNQWREIHLEEGRPSYVLSNAPEHRLPELLAQHAMLTREGTGALLHGVLGSKLTIEQIASQHSSDIARNWPLVMRDRLAEIFQWSAGRYAFDPQGTPWRREPFSRATFSVLIDMVNRSIPENALVDSLSPWLNRALRPSETLTSTGKKLGLPPQAWQFALELAKGRTIASLQKISPDQKKTLIVAYILIEAGLILTPL